MNPYDTEAVRAVWARVTATQEQRLAAMIADEHAARDGYLLLARSFPRYRNLFRSIAQDEARHIKKLSGLYFLLFGTQANVAAAKPKRQAALCDAIRASYKAELEAVQTYQNAASHFAAQRELFLALSADEARHASRLHALAETLQCK